MPFSGGRVRTRRADHAGPGRRGVTIQRLLAPQAAGDRFHHVRFVDCQPDCGREPQTAAAGAASAAGAPRHHGLSSTPATPTPRQGRRRRGRPRPGRADAPRIVRRSIHRRMDHRGLPRHVAQPAVEQTAPACHRPPTATATFSGSLSVASGSRPPLARALSGYLSFARVPLEQKYAAPTHRRHWWMTAVCQSLVLLKCSDRFVVARRLKRTPNRPSHH